MKPPFQGGFFISGTVVCRRLAYKHGCGCII
jgi:hypothetical protein